MWNVREIHFNSQLSCNLYICVCVSSGAFSTQNGVTRLAWEARQVKEGASFLLISKNTYIHDV